MRDRAATAQVAQAKRIVAVNQNSGLFESFGHVLQIGSFAGGVFPAAYTETAGNALPKWKTGWVARSNRVWNY
jgi:hypothetical protein